MKRKKPQYEFPVAGEAWTGGAGAPAGVFFLDGSCHVVAERGPAEAALRELGALQIATVRFDRPTVRNTRAVQLAIPPLPTPNRN